MSSFLLTVAHVPGQTTNYCCHFRVFCYHLQISVIPNGARCEINFVNQLFQLLKNSVQNRRVFIYVQQIDSVLFYRDCTVYH